MGSGRLRSAFRGRLDFRIVIPAFEWKAAASRRGLFRRLVAKTGNQFGFDEPAPAFEINSHSEGSGCQPITIFSASENCEGVILDAAISL